jgi:glycerol-3-phosphate dehydrogenase (NAD(P)+)
MNGVNMKEKNNGNVIVIGAGNWGTTLALLFCKRNDVYLWCIDQTEADAINSDRINSSFLPGVVLPDSITVEAKFARPINPEDTVIVAIPSRKVDSLVDEFLERGIEECIMVNVSKGVEHTNLMTVGHTLCTRMPRMRFATLSGPTIARELAEGLPAKAVLASKDVALLFHLQTILDNDLLKFEFSRDIRGVELAASLKGLIAIAVGIADGLGFKTNITGLIMTYGLREFNTVMQFLGVQSETVYGIAGMGDLITTCMSPNSRNRRFGQFLAKGLSRDEALQEVGMVVEGVTMALTIQKLAKFNLSIPLISCITRIIFEDVKDIRGELIATLNNIS